MAEFDVSAEDLTGGPTLKAFEDPDLDGKIFPSFDTPKSVKFRSHVAVSGQRRRAGRVYSSRRRRIPSRVGRRDRDFHLRGGGGVWNVTDDDAHLAYRVCHPAAVCTPTLPVLWGI